MLSLLYLLMHEKAFSNIYIYKCKHTTYLYSFPQKYDRLPNSYIKYYMSFTVAYMIHRITKNRSTWQIAWRLLGLNSRVILPSYWWSGLSLKTKAESRCIIPACCYRWRVCFVFPKKCAEYFVATLTFISPLNANRQLWRLLKMDYF